MKNYLHYPHCNGVIAPSDRPSPMSKPAPQTQLLRNPQYYDEHHRHRPHRKVAPTKLDYIPIASAVALVISWLGLIFFCTKMHYGIGSIIVIAQQMFANVVPYLKNAQIAFVFLGIVMALTTLAMAVIGACTTINCSHYDCNCQPPSKWSRRLGSRWVCGTFVALNHVLHICWLGILSFLVGLLAAYLGFSPVCIHKAGALDGSMCFNFSTFTALLAGPNNHDKMVNLVLCGDPVSQFCQLTHSILPWYGWAYFGCICVILGLSNFNSCLAANFAHSLRHSTSSSASNLHHTSSLFANEKEARYDGFGAHLLLDSSRCSSRRTGSPSSAAYGEFGGGFPPPRYHMSTDGMSNRLLGGLHPLPFGRGDDINEVDVRKNGNGSRVLLASNDSYDSAFEPYVPAARPDVTYPKKKIPKESHV